jgi:hypothetical protein
MKKRVGIQYVSSSSNNVAPYNNNLTSGQNLGKMGTNSGSLIRKFNHCKESGVADVLECTLNPDCCPQEKQKQKQKQKQNDFSVFGGIYVTSDGSNHAFVLDQVNGTWQTSITDISFGNPNLQPNLIFVSCSALGYAVAGIKCSLNDYDNNSYSYIINQKASVWDSSATKILFQDACFNQHSGISSISSPAPGYAVAGGQYTDTNNNNQSYIINQKSGVWDSFATKILFQDACFNPQSSINSISSPAPGYAVAGGQYTDTSNNVQSYIINQKSGVWDSSATKILFHDACFNPQSSINSISSPAPGYAVAGGQYTDTNNNNQFYIINQKAEVWVSFATKILFQDASSNFNNKIYLSSSAAGYAVGGGTYEDIHGKFQGFIINQNHGIWDSYPTKVLKDNTSIITGISSSSPGFAVVSGADQDRNGKFNTFLLNQKRGVWDSYPQNIAFQDICSNHVAFVESISSSSPGYAVCGGLYIDTSNHFQIFRTNQVNGVLEVAQKIVETTSTNKNEGISVSSVKK